MSYCRSGKHGKEEVKHELGTVEIRTRRQAGAWSSRKDQEVHCTVYNTVQNGKRS
jgi:hypothetical protein